MYFGETRKFFNIGAWTGPTYNHDFWAFSPINSQSAFNDGYHVRNGLEDDPSFDVHEGLFTLHWLYLENEVWLD